MAAKTPSKSEFVMSFPASVPPNDVAVKAAEAGLALTLKAVNAIRNLAKANLAKTAGRVAAPTRRSGRPPGSKKDKAAPGEATNKSAFVRSLPESMPLREVVAKAKAQGIKLSEGHVSAIRSLARAKLKWAAAGAPKRGPGRPRGSRTRKPAAAASASFEQALVDLVLDHGVRRVEEALAAIRERLARSLA
jgi:hypothetical protein